LDAEGRRHFVRITNNLNVCFRDLKIEYLDSPNVRKGSEVPVVSHLQIPIFLIPQTPRNISYRITTLGDLMDSIMFEIVTEFRIIHNSLLA